MPRKWRSYRDHRLCDASSPYVYRPVCVDSPPPRVTASTLPAVEPGRRTGRYRSIAGLRRRRLFSIRGLATPWTYFLCLSRSSVILTDSSTRSPVHVLMLSIQAVRGLPRLRAPDTVPCVISFSRQRSVRPATLMSSAVEMAQDCAINK